MGHRMGHFAERIMSGGPALGPSVVRLVTGTFDAAPPPPTARVAQRRRTLELVQHCGEHVDGDEGAGVAWRTRARCRAYGRCGRDLRSASRIPARTAMRITR